MPQTIIDCCNSALQRVGASTIMSLSDNSPEARACSIAYDSNRRDEMRRHPWNFAITRAVLAPDAIAPAFDYTYQFTLPTDCLRVLRSDYYGSDWVIEGRKILTNYDNPLYLRYIADIIDPTQWDGTFYNVVTGALAIDICERLTQSNTKKELLVKQYQDDVRVARRMNAFESGPEDGPNDSWLIARL